MPNPIKTPAGYVPEFAMAYSDGAGDSVVVSAAQPLPVTFEATVPATALTGQATADGLIGPYVPAGRNAIVLNLAGDWTGQVTLMRSVDGGVTLASLTALGSPYGIYSGNICEPVWEESEADATLYLDAEIASGTLSYRMGQ